ncbi:MAG TPA: PIN domain-containing protein [Candidatus Limnocylindria bacterium]|nr:PIN domain-containing protein [Candidatus Limnocylindria bacterium]
MEPPPFVDTNVLVRHITGDPPELARRATRYLASARALLLLDLVVAEFAYVLKSVYGLPRAEIGVALRALLGLPAIRAVDHDLLHRSIEIFEHDRVGFVDAYLVASAERSGVKRVVSFDRSIDRVKTVTRIEPA